MLSKLNKMVFNKGLVFTYALTYLMLSDFVMLLSSLSPDCGILYNRYTAPSHLLFFDAFRSICHGYPISLSLGEKESQNSNSGGHVYKYPKFQLYFYSAFTAPWYAIYVVYLDAVRGGENFVVNSDEGDHKCI